MSKPSTSASPPRILYVEDDPDMIALVGQIWGEDIAVESADSLQKAATRLEAERFDIVLLDVYLPDGESVELLESLRGGKYGDNNQRTPVVMLTASDVQKHYETAWELDSIAYVRKPLSIVELTEAVDRCLPVGYRRQTVDH